jgi:hypothetical protein
MVITVSFYKLEQLPCLMLRCVMIPPQHSL